MFVGALGLIPGEQLTTHQTISLSPKRRCNGLSRLSWQVACHGGYFHHNDKDANLILLLPMVGEKCPVEVNPCGINPLSPPNPAVTGTPLRSDLLLTRSYEKYTSSA